MATLTFTNTTPVAIDNATASRAIKAYGATGHLVTDVSVGLHGYSTSYTGDLDVLLVAPDALTNLVVLSDVRGGDNAVLADLTLTDSALLALGIAGINTDIVSGPYRPIDYIPAGETASSYGLSGLTLNYAVGAGTDFAVFDGLDANGLWNLYIRDDIGSDPTSINHLTLTLETDGNTVSLTGDASDQIFSINRTSETSGIYGMTNENNVSYLGVERFVISGGGGHDIVDFSAGALAIYVDLSDSQGINGFAFSGIEEVYATNFDDTLIGSSGNDTLRGQDGDDLFYGQGGSDSLSGGAGLHDTVSYELAQGGIALNMIFPQLVNTGEAFGDKYDGIEDVIGTLHDDQIVGNTGANILSGSEGSDQLSGFTGNDLLYGGTGNDTLSGDAGRDYLDGGDGFDIATYIGSAFGVRASLTSAALNGGWAAGDQYLSIEGLSGSGSHDTLVGDGARNLIKGESGNDLLYGAGGNDTVQGGLNSDTIDGNDGDDWLYGEDGNDSISGGAGNDLLTAGSGVDRLAGGAGNDTFVTDGGDSIVENLGSGTDQVNSSASVTALWANVENLVLTGFSAINGTGNNLANRITGNSGNNILNGGTGIDTLIGGTGNDTFVTDGGDTVTEAFGQGADQINSSASVLELAANVERLLLTGATAINGTGNSLANQITGNGAANKLSGGAGLDTLTGGAGQDSFVFNTALAAGNVDKITDFKVVDDSIVLENAVFRGLATGGLAASAFAKNLTGAATDALDRIIYETDTGKLFFDADGTGATVRLHFATLATGLALTQADFTVI